VSIHTNSALVPNLLPGLAHQTLAGPEHGLRGLALWSQVIDPNAATPPHRHDCEEAVVVLEGEGTLILRGTESRFRGGDSVILPPNEVHQLINTGSGPLRLLAAFNMSPVKVELPDGTPIELPWQSGVGHRDARPQPSSTSSDSAPSAAQSSTTPRWPTLDTSTPKLK
jgi:quercetin dioxygenase-like cupin family protein